MQFNNLHLILKIFDNFASAADLQKELGKKLSGMSKIFLLEIISNL